MQFKIRHFILLLVEWRLLYYLIVVFSLLIAVVYGYVKYNQDTTIATQAESRIDTELASIMSMIGSFVYQYDYTSVRTVAKTLLARPEISGVTIIDAYEFIIFNESGRLTHGDIHSEKNITIFHHVESGRIFLGSAIIIADHVNEDKITKNAINAGLNGFLFLLMLTLLLATLYLTVFIVRPLDSLSRAIDQTLRTGKPVKASNIQRNTLGRFGSQFNEMQEILSHTREALKLERDRVKAHSLMLDDIMHSISMGVQYFNMSNTENNYNQIFGDTAAGNLNFPNRLVKSASRYTDWAKLELGYTSKIIFESSTSSHVGVIYEVENYLNNGSVYSIKLLCLSEKRYAYLANNITDEKSLENALNKALKLETVGLLISGIAHDFNNIIAIISGCLEITLAEPENVEKVLYHSSTALNATKRGSNVISSLLRSVSRGQNNTSEHQVLETIEDVLKIANDTVGANVNLELVNDLETEVCIATPNLDTALLNLIINARDAMYPNGGEIVIHVSTVGSSTIGKLNKTLEGMELLRISVQDNGPGISQEVIEKIFTPFVTTKSGRGGTGLGLLMVKNFINSANGHIEFRNNDNSGAVFEMYLPGSIKPNENTALEPKAAVFNLNTQISSHLVMVVDDEAPLLDLMKATLSAYGIDIIAAAGMREAERYLTSPDSGIPDVIVSDLNLADGSGLTILEMPAVIEYDIPMILITGAIDYHAQIDRNQSKLFDILEKPFQLTAFVEAVTSALKVH